MMLWANAYRSYLEVEVGAAPEDVGPLCKWVEDCLSSEANSKELELHRKPLGSWTRQEAINGSWSQESGTTIMWALGIYDNLAPWWSQAHWDDKLDDLHDLPNSATWRPLRPIVEIDRAAMVVETLYWRLIYQETERDDGGYARMLLGRAESLGHLVTGSDGDLCVEGGRSIHALSTGELRTLSSICRERLHALNWLCGQEASWDDIACDTIVSWLWSDDEGNWKPPDRMASRQWI